MGLTFKQKRLSKSVFNSLCAVLDENEVKYNKRKGKLALNCTMQGEDLPVYMDVVVDQELSVVLVLSPLPFSVPKERRDAIAVAVCDINAYLTDGCFDFNWFTGEITFRISASFANSIIGKEMPLYLASTVLKTVDAYNDKLLFLSKSDIPADKITEYLR